MLKLLERPVFHRFPVIHHACDNTRLTCKYYNSPGTTICNSESKKYKQQQQQKRTREPIFLQRLDQSQYLQYR